MIYKIYIALHNMRFVKRNTLKTLITYGETMSKYQRLNQLAKIKIKNDHKIFTIGIYDIKI